MCGQLRKVRITPVGKAYHLSILSFHSRNLKQLQNVESPCVEEEGVMPKQFAELDHCRMILGKYLRSKLSQCLGYLDFVQLHHCSSWALKAAPLLWAMGISPTLPNHWKQVPEPTRRP
jgi:hypothetical protein